MKRLPHILGLAFLFTLLANIDVSAQSTAQSTANNGIQVFVTDGSSDGMGNLTISLQILILFTVLSIVPALLIMTTSFVRIIIVLSFLKSGMTLQQPPSQVLLAMAMFLTFFIMKPTWDELYEVSLKPQQEGQINTVEALKNAEQPVKAFMLQYVRDSELAFFIDASNYSGDVDNAQDLPMHIVMPAFMLSELKTGFMMGLLILLPFLVIDMVIASILMSLGMFMLPPPIIALPIKLMLFVLVDGWTLLLTSLVTSFKVG
ncbi:MAG: flagellar type III secretion system pore protein FliP [Verrucomicrobiota bacterium]